MPQRPPGREDLWAILLKRRGEELSRQASLDIAINNPGPSRCRPDYCGSIKEKVLQWISVCALSWAQQLYLGAQSGRVDQNQMVHCGQLLYTSLMLFLSKLYFPSQKPQDGRVWSNNVEIFTYSFVTADCMIHFNGSKSIPSVRNIIILLCSDEYLEILAFTN